MRGVIPPLAHKQKKMCLGKRFPNSETGIYEIYSVGKYCDPLHDYIRSGEDANLKNNNFVDR